MKKTQVYVALALLAALSGGAYWYFNTPAKAPAAAAKSSAPVPIKAARAESGEMPVRLEVVGRAEAYESVAVKARVDGQVAAVD